MTGSRQQVRSDDRTPRSVRLAAKAHPIDALLAQDQAHLLAPYDEDSYALFLIVHPQNGARRWSVNLSRGGRAVQMSFPHLRHGGEAPALAVARACRDAIAAAVPALTNRDVREKRRRNRSEGMTGVYRAPRPRDGGMVWAAQIQLPDGRTRRRSFAIGRFGEAGARRRAEAARRAMLDEVETIAAPVLHSPTALALAGRGPMPSITVPIITPEDLPGLSRLADEGAWQVRVPACGVMITARFRDRRFGDAAAALAVARAYRTAVLAFVPVVAPDGHGRRRTGTAAMPGIYRRLPSPGRGATWCASTTDADRRVRNRSFAVSRHGENGARRLAEAERVRMLDAEQRASCTEREQKLRAE